MPELVHMSAGLTLDAIACKEEDAVVVDYILKGQSVNTQVSRQPVEGIEPRSPSERSELFQMKFYSTVCNSHRF